MALNQIAYFPNPGSSSTIGTLRTTNGTTSIYTVPALETKKVTSFIVSITGVAGGGANENVTGILKIGSAQFAVNLFLASTSTHVDVIAGGEEWGYKGSFIQAGDTITFTVTESGTPNYSAAVTIGLDDYTA